MRQDILTGDWVSVAAARQNRAFLPPAELDPLAPQTPDQPVRDPLALRRRRVREQVAVVRSRPRRRRRRPARGADPPRGLDDLAAPRPRPHPHQRRPLRGRLLLAPSTRARSAPRPSPAPAPSSRRGPIAPPRCRPCPASSRCSRSRTAARPSASRCTTRTGRSTPTRTSRRAPRVCSTRSTARRPTCSSASSSSSRPVRPRHPARRALDRVRAVRRALADRGAPAAAPPRPRLRRPHRRRARRARPALPAAAPRRRRALRHPDAVHRRLAPGAGPRRARHRPPEPAADEPAPRGRQAQVPRRLRGRHGRLDRRRRRPRPPPTGCATPIERESSCDRRRARPHGLFAAARPAAPRRGHLVRARPRQPDRRAHRLQRRLRLPVRDRPPHRTSPSGCATTAASGSPSTFDDGRRRGRAARARRSVPRPPRRDRGVGALSARASRGRSCAGRRRGRA